MRTQIVLLHSIGNVVRRAHEMLLRMSSEAQLKLADFARLALAAGCRVPVPQLQAA